MSRIVVVREVERRELAAAGDVVVRAYQGLDDEATAAHGAYLEHIRDVAGRVRHCPVLVAVDSLDGTVRGCVTYVPDHANPFAEVEREGEAGFRMLGVAPEAQGRGVGRALAEACIDRARVDGRTGVAISTRPVMRTAHRLYERLGFRRAPERDFEPVPGIELWAYVLAL